MHTVECLKDTPPMPDPSSTHMGKPPKCKRLLVSSLPWMGGRGEVGPKDTPTMPSPSSTQMGQPPKCKCWLVSSLPWIKGGRPCILYSVPRTHPMPSPSSTQMGKPPKCKRPLVSSLPWMGGRWVRPCILYSVPRTHLLCLPPPPPKWDNPQSASVGLCPVFLGWGGGEHAYYTVLLGHTPYA